MPSRRGSDEEVTGTGALVLVATPIGNLADLSERAIDELSAADVIACEDTRKARRLLSHAGVRPKELLVVHEHNEARQAEAIIDRLARRQRVAVISDAGMPGVSDPGERLVRAAVGAGHRVEVVPGPSAAIAALVVSGLPTGRFVFEGFLPRKGSGRKERLRALTGETRTAVLYEAPHRLARTLTDLSEALGHDRPVVLVRELTKLHEEIWRGTLAEAAMRCDGVEPRGEYVLVVAGAHGRDAASDEQIEQAIQRARTAGLSTKDAVSSVAAELEVPRRRVYELATGS